jgi:hypothetical protein
MRHPWSVAAVLTLVALAAYFAGAHPVAAQSDIWPFSAGETVTLEFADGATRQCRVEEIKGGFARCGNPADRQGSTIGRREPPESWVNVAVVKGLTRPMTQLP